MINDVLKMAIKNNLTPEDLALFYTKDVTHIWIIKTAFNSSKNPLINKIIKCYIFSEFTIIKNEYGKPFIQCDEKIAPHLSISHSGSYLVLALCFFSPVGVDIEVLKERQQWQKIATRYHFKSSCLTTFYKEWTAREAYLKTTQQGLFTGLATMCTNKDEGSLRIGTTTLNHKIYFHQRDDYIVALCLNLTTNNYLKYFHI